MKTILALIEQGRRPFRPSRFLSLTVALLLLSHLALSLFGYAVTRQLDRHYSELIDLSVAPLQSMQLLTSDVLRTMAKTNAQLYNSANDTENRRRVADARAAVMAEKGECDHVLHASWISADSERRAALTDACERFTREAGTVLNLYAEGKYSEAREDRETKLRQYFNDYITAIVAASDSVALEAARVKRFENQRSGSASIIQLAWLGGSVASGLTLLSAVFLGALILSRTTPPVRLQ